MWNLLPKRIRSNVWFAQTYCPLAVIVLCLLLVISWVRLWLWLWRLLAINICFFIFWNRREKTCLRGFFPTKWVSNQPAQLQRLARKNKISLVASIDMIFSKQRITKSLIRLRVCTGWPAPLLLANLRRQVFSRRGLFVLFYLRRFSESRSSCGSTPSVRLSATPLGA